MANTLTAVAPRILAMGLLALRNQCVMPRLINGDYAPQAAQRGSTIDVPVASAVAVQTVSPSNTAPSTADQVPSFVQVPLDQWKEAPFYMTDDDMFKAANGYLPMQASEAVKAISETINSYIMTTMYKEIYGFAGTAGTAPFQSDLTAATAARKVLALQMAPLSPRSMVIDPTAEAYALGLAQFTSANVSGSERGLYEGWLGRKLGFDWFMDQQVPIHTSTVLTAGAATVNGVNALGATTVSIAKATNTSPLVKGDIISFSGDSQTYTVMADVTLAVGNTNVTVSPGLKVAKTGGETVTLKASHTANLAFHRDCFAFAMRPLLDVETTGLGSITQQAVDPLTGLSLRLEITREHKRTRWSFDALYGGRVVRPELGCRLAG